MNNVNDGPQLSLLGKIVKAGLAGKQVEIQQPSRICRGPIARIDVDPNALHLFLEWAAEPSYPHDWSPGGKVQPQWSYSEDPVNIRIDPAALTELSRDGTQAIISNGVPPLQVTIYLTEFDRLDPATVKDIPPRYLSPVEGARAAPAG